MELFLKLRSTYLYRLLNRYLPLSMYTFLRIPKVHTFTDFWTGIYLYLCIPTFVYPRYIPLPTSEQVSTFIYLYLPSYTQGTYLYPPLIRYLPLSMCTYLRIPKVHTFTDFWTGIYLYLCIPYFVNPRYIPLPTSDQVSTFIHKKPTFVYPRYIPLPTSDQVSTFIQVYLGYLLWGSEPTNTYYLLIYT